MENIENFSKEIHPTPTHYQRNKLFKKMFKIHPILKLQYFIDICGTGEILTFLDNYQMEGEGIDLSETCVEISSNRTSNRITVFQMDFMELNNKKYQLILLIDVLEHIKDDGEFLMKANSMLTNNHYLLINVPAKMKLFDLTDKFWGHIRRYEKEDMINLLEENNFEIIEFWSYGIPFLKKVCCLLLKKTKEENAGTLKSGNKTYSMMKYLAPIIKPFYWLLNIQNLFKNANTGSQYLILTKKMGNKYEN